MILKNWIFNGNQNKLTSTLKNSWNFYSIEDLKSRSINWETKRLEDYIKNQAIVFPAENDISKLNIEEGQCTCINYGDTRNFNPKSCFI